METVTEREHTDGQWCWCRPIPIWQDQNTLAWYHNDALGTALGLLPLSLAGVRVESRGAA